MQEVKTTSGYEDKKVTRIEGYRERAERAAAQAQGLSHRASDMVADVPLGQSLPKGYREQMWSALDKSLEAQEKAAYYASKAKAAEENKAVSSDDPEAIEKLKNKLSAEEIKRERLKRLNTYYRTHSTCAGCEGISDELAAKLDAMMQEAPSWQTGPVPDYQLDYSGAEIRRLKGRIAALEVERATEYVGWEFEGGRAEVNREENRLQLLFDEKPDWAVRSALDKAGFHWAPSNDAWQRQLNRRAFAAADTLPCIKSLSGVLPSALQPESPPQPKKERRPVEKPPTQEVQGANFQDIRGDWKELSPFEKVHILISLGEAGLMDVFQADTLPPYLDTIARYPQYSYFNSMLIHLQAPGAEQAQAYRAWKAEGRFVRPGEEGIMILAPCPRRDTINQQVIDPNTHQPQFTPDGTPVTSETEIIRPRFKAKAIFSLSQTEQSEEAPKLELPELEEAVEPDGRAEFAVPRDIGLIRDMTYSALEQSVPESDDEELMDIELDDPQLAAESAAYVVCRRYGLDTIEFDFQPVLDWSGDKELNDYKDFFRMVHKAAVATIETLEGPVKKPVLEARSHGNDRKSYRKKKGGYRR
nr:DUF3560 domain-containing protein [Pseudoflavonifractor phocaeensis]